MLDKWLAMSDSGDVEIEVSKWYQTLTEETVTRTAFGPSYEDGQTIFQLQAQQMALASEAFQKVFIPGYRYFFFNYFPCCQFLIIPRFKVCVLLIFPRVRLVWFITCFSCIRFLPTRRNLKSWKLEKEIKKSLMKVIDERRKNWDSEKMLESGPKDLLGLMIQASMKRPTTTTEFNSASSPPITVHDIAEECKSFFFAGEQTTSNLLTWTTVLLAMHPQWQVLARDEVLKVCGPHDIPTKDDVSKLKMVINSSSLPSAFDSNIFFIFISGFIFFRMCARCRLASRHRLCEI